jgi:riboflavin kinase/FMN adenylyltransferase
VNFVVDWQEEFPAASRGGSVAIGNFDGAHTGHASLIRELVRQARATHGGPAVALTFSPHPVEVLRPGTRVELLTTPADRAALLAGLGADLVLTLKATPELFRLSAREFFDRVVRGNLDARGMVEGANFCFGRDREGDVELLAEFCREAGMPLSVVPPYFLDGIEVSSSRIRQELQRGDVALAAKLLGRPYHLRGVVVGGKRRGRTIGFPTANLEGIATVIPAGGVYATRARTAAGEAYPSATNVGPSPTFGEEAPRVEVHLIGFAGDLYGQELEIEFLARLRETRPFAGPAELIEQLRRDVEQARSYAASR